MFKLIKYKPPFCMFSVFMLSRPKVPLSGRTKYILYFQQYQIVRFKKSCSTYLLQCFYRGKFERELTIVRLA